MAENCSCKSCTVDLCFTARGLTKTCRGNSNLLRAARKSGQLLTETQLQLHIPVLNAKTTTNGAERFRQRKSFLLTKKSSASSGCCCISNLSEEGAECLVDKVEVAAGHLTQRVGMHGLLKKRSIFAAMHARTGEAEFGKEGESAAIEVQRLSDPASNFDGRTLFVNEKQRRTLEGDDRVELGVEHCNSKEEDHFSNVLAGHSLSQNIFRSRRTLLIGASISGLALKMYRPGTATAEAKTAGTTKEVSGLRAETGEAQVLEGQEKGKGSRIYDATVLGEPVAVGKDKGRVWQKLLAARVVYLGEAERVPDPDDKVLELEIVHTLRDRCFEQQRPVSLAMQEIPCTLQPQLNQYMSKRLSDSELRALVTHWSDERWKEYQPLLQYCRNNGVRLMACGTPLEVLRTIQAKGVQGLSNADQRKYVPPVGGGYALSGPLFQQLSLADVLPNASVPFGPGPFHFAQARIVEDFTMSQVVIQAMADGGSVGLLVVIVGASHILFGSKGAGLPARISKKLQKRTQAVVLLNPERQRIRKEGDMPVADFLWYSAEKLCVRNCFDRAEVARVMDAAGRRRDALPKDVQTGLDLGLVSPDVLKDFFDLEKQPFIAELTHHFQGFRERWFADPRFLQRLAIEETISITTTLIAQYERRKERFLKELDYVITDTVRGAVVDFFTVWLPAPTLSFRSSDTQPAASNILEGLKGLLGLFPDNAFQRATAGENWNIPIRVGAVILGGVKLFCVGVISSISTVTATNTLLGIQERFNPKASKRSKNKRSPIFKTAFVYGSFLGLSANLRYQAIAGIVEHWIADYFLASQPLAGNMLSFVARTANSYWGTQQWVDLARFTGLQAHQAESQVVPVHSDVKPDMAHETLDFKASLSEIAVDSFDSKTISWEIPAVDLTSTVEEDQVTEKMEKSEIHGNQHS